MSYQPVYLDNQATTPVDPRVVEAMFPYFMQEYGNPHSVDHVYGWTAADAVERARREIAALIGADAREIIFTSGATESCNLAVRGLCRSMLINDSKDNGLRRKIVTIATEHPCILETCLDAKWQGYEAVVLGVRPDGIVDLNQLQETVDEKTLLVTVMTANNEIGVVQPVAEIVEICHAQGAYFHTDATQAVGKIPVDVKGWGVDMLSLSGHKMYGPKGIGALYIKWDSGLAIQPLVTGGGQESGLRPGTVPVPLVVGLGEACRLAKTDMQTDAKSIQILTDQLLSDLLQVRPDAVLYGHPEMRVIGNINLGVPGYSGSDIIEAVSDRLAISTGSACSSAKVEPSRVLMALGIDAEAAQSAIRLSVGRFNTKKDINYAVSVLSETIETNCNSEVANAS